MILFCNVRVTCAQHVEYGSARVPSNNKGAEQHALATWRPRADYEQEAEGCPIDPVTSARQMMAVSDMPRLLCTRDACEWEAWAYFILFDEHSFMQTLPAQVWTVLRGVARVRSRVQMPQSRLSRAVLHVQLLRPEIRQGRPGISDMMLICFDLHKTPACSI